MKLIYIWKDSKLLHNFKVSWWFSFKRKNIYENLCTHRVVNAVFYELKYSMMILDFLSNIHEFLIAQLWQYLSLVSIKITILEFLFIFINSI